MYVGVLARAAPAHFARLSPSACTLQRFVALVRARGLDVWAWPADVRVAPDDRAAVEAAFPCTVLIPDLCVRACASQRTVRSSAMRLTQAPSASADPSWRPRLRHSGAPRAAATFSTRTTPWTSRQRTPGPARPCNTHRASALRGRIAWLHPSPRLGNSTPYPRIGNSTPYPRIGNSALARTSASSPSADACEGTLGTCRAWRRASPRWRRTCRR
jgi:hypothetical protein